MDKEYLVQQLSEIAARYNVPADREALGELVAISIISSFLPSTGGQGSEQSHLKQLGRGQDSLRPGHSV